MMKRIFEKWPLAHRPTVARKAFPRMRLSVKNLAALPCFEDN
jgi:hypothetical protein